MDKIVQAFMVNGETTQNAWNDVRPEGSPVVDDWKCFNKIVINFTKIPT